MQHFRPDYCLRRKNKFPVGGETVTLFVPLFRVMEYPLAVQFAGTARFAFCCRV